MFDFKEKIADELSTNFNSLLCLGAFTGIKSACDEDGNSSGRLEYIPDKIEGFCGAQRCLLVLSRWSYIIHM